MNKKEKIIEGLSKELEVGKDSRINVRMTKDLHEKLLAYKDKTGVSISNIIRIALMNYFVENEVND